jgi:hypothetical protein
LGDKILIREKIRLYNETDGAQKGGNIMNTLMLIVGIALIIMALKGD